MRRLSVVRPTRAQPSGGDAGDDEDSASEGDDGEEAVGAQERGCVLGRSVGRQGGYEVAVEPAREAPAGADGASHKDQHDEGNEPRGGLGPGDDERQAEAAGDDQLMEAALAPIGQR